MNERYKYKTIKRVRVYFCLIVGDCFRFYKQNIKWKIIKLTPKGNIMIVRLRTLNKVK